MRYIIFAALLLANIARADVIVMDATFGGSNVASLSADQRDHGETIVMIINRVNPLVNVQRMQVVNSYDLTKAVLGINKNERHVINMSFTQNSPVCAGVVQNAIVALQSKGHVVIAAAGNEASTLFLPSPANCKDVITVGSGANGVISSFSNRSPRIDVYANPRGHDSIARQGTSFSTARVSAIVANLLEKHPDASVAELRSMLLSMSDDKRILN